MVSSMRPCYHFFFGHSSIVCIVHHHLSVPTNEAFEEQWEHHSFCITGQNKVQAAVRGNVSPWKWTWSGKKKKFLAKKKKIKSVHILSLFSALNHYIYIYYISFITFHSSNHFDKHLPHKGDYQEPHFTAYLGVQYWHLLAITCTTVMLFYCMLLVQ